MDYEGLAELVIPLVLFGIMGGLIALRMLKPYGDKILDLIREIQKERHETLSETRDLQAIRDRLDMLTERQDFLEALIHRRLGEEEQAELERLRRRELGPAGVGPSAAGSRAGEASEAAVESADADRGDGPGEAAG